MNYNKLCLGCFRENNSGSPVCPSCGFDKNAYNETAAEKMYLTAGTILQGKYLVGKMLGAGGFGITYQAFQMTLDRVVAIKEFFPSNLVVRGEEEGHKGRDINVKVLGAGSREIFDRTLSSFVTEGRNLASINLPGVVGIYDCFRENSTAYLAMEYIGGQNLKEYQKDHGGKLGEKELLDLLNPVIRSMSKIHEMGIIHRDISPDNLILNSDGKLVLVDFGAARSMAGREEGGKSLTVVLKQGYAPLEQYDPYGNQGPWTDVYALCATMYRLLTGRKPATASVRVQDENSEEKTRNELMEAGASAKTASALAAGMRVLYSRRIQNMDELWKALYDSSYTAGSSSDPQPGLKKDTAGAKADRAADAEEGAAAGAEADRAADKVRDTAFVSASGSVSAFASSSEKEERSNVRLEKREDRPEDAKDDHFTSRHSAGMSDPPKKSQKKPLLWILLLAALIGVIAFFASRVSRKPAVEPESQTGTEKQTQVESEKQSGTAVPAEGGSEAQSETAVSGGSEEQSGTGASGGAESQSETTAPGGVELQSETGGPGGAELQSETAAASGSGSGTGSEDMDKLIEEAEGYLWSGQYEAALALFRQAVDAGNAFAMNEIGYMYNHGLGVEQDYEKSLEWYRKAADAGDGSALTNLGYMYFNGFAVDQDYAKAMEYFEQAAEMGVSIAMTSIGHMYYMGAGVEQDYEKAMEWYLKGAEAGDPDAMNSIGFMYQNGQAVDVDYVKGVEWYRKGAEGGNMTAMFNLGWSYLYAAGVTENAATALNWLYRSLEAGLDQTAAEPFINLAVQKVLNSLGYDCGDADGVLGDMTKDAIRAFRSDQGMEAADTVDDALLRKLLEVTGETSGLNGEEDSSGIGSGNTITGGSGAELNDNIGISLPNGG